MTPLNNEPRMERNYILALLLSMLVLLGYPFLLRWLNPPSQTPEAIESEQAPLTPTLAPSATNRWTDPSSGGQAGRGSTSIPPEAPTVIHHETELYEIEFATLGGSISRLLYKGGVKRNGVIRTLFFENNPSEPGLFNLQLHHEEADLRRAPFKLSRSGGSDGVFEFVYEKAGGYRLTKRFSFDRGKPVIHLEVDLENLSPRERHFALELASGLGRAEVLQTELPQYQGVVFADKIHSADLNKISKKGFSISGELAWSGVVRKYFALLVKPDWKAIASDFKASEEALWVQMRLEPVTVAAGEKSRGHFLIYAGPQHYETLKSLDADFESLLSRGFFGFFKIWLLIALKFCYGFTHNFGWSIILLTLAIKLAFTPLSHMSFESMKKMQALSPKLKSLQERFKNDPAKLNREMMELYRRNRVNPMSGCLPMVLQIPIFIAFYQVLSEAVELKGAPFIGWIQDLSEPDHLFFLPFTVPLLGWDSFNLLPFLMLGSMIWQQKLTPQSGANPEQTKIMEWMPVMFGFMFYNLPSGLVLYWFVNNVLSIVHQVFVKRMVIILHHEDRE